MLLYLNDRSYCKSSQLPLIATPTGEPKPPEEVEKYKASLRETAIVREGDWSCPTCGENVFANRNACFKCETEKPLDAAPANGKIQKKTQNQYRDGDWTCPDCSAHNFSSKTSCFKCHIPKPEGVVTHTGNPAPTGPITTTVPLTEGQGLGLPQLWLVALRPPHLLHGVRGAQAGRSGQ